MRRGESRNYPLRTHPSIPRATIDVSALFSTFPRFSPTIRTPGICLTIIVKLVCQRCRFICDHTATTTALAILKSLRSSLEAHKDSTHLWCLLHEATSDIYTFLTEDGMLLKAIPSVKGLPVSIYQHGRSELYQPRVSQRVSSIDLRLRHSVQLC